MAAHLRDGELAERADPAGAFKAALCRPGERSIGPAERSRYLGCRVDHTIQFGMVGLKIRAGSAAPAGRDEAVAFMLDELALDQLIADLRGIRVALDQESENAAG